ncbi:MAG TPA: hypothetical protein VFJ02_15715 [Vicinamibacterales bacterium]|nr:hypothetical protein [Vicinamibacterales bacterium]
MRTCFRVVVSALLALVMCGTQAAAAAPAHARLTFTGLSRLRVARAIEGARQRLADPVCQQVLSDFRDASGRTLLAKLQVVQKSPIEFLDDVWFVDASEFHPCRRRDALVAYTTPGQKVIYVCGSRFVHPIFRLDGPLAELLIIHEVLHALGLPENPPTSRQITQQVAKRCGR